MVNTLSVTVLKFLFRIYQYHYTMLFHYTLQEKYLFSKGPGHIHKHVIASEYHQQEVVNTSYYNIATMSKIYNSVRKVCMEHSAVIVQR